MLSFCLSSDTHGTFTSQLHISCPITIHLTFSFCYVVLCILPHQISCKRESACSLWWWWQWWSTLILSSQLTTSHEFFPWKGGRMSIVPHPLICQRNCNHRTQFTDGHTTCKLLGQLTLLIGSSTSKCSLHLRKSRHTSRASVRAFTGITFEVAREGALDAALDFAEPLSCVLDEVLEVPHPWWGDNGSLSEWSFSSVLPFSYLWITHFTMLMAAVRR